MVKNNKLKIYRKPKYEKKHEHLRTAEQSQVLRPITES